WPDRSSIGRWRGLAAAIPRCARDGPSGWLLPPALPELKWSERQAEPADCSRALRGSCGFQSPACLFLSSGNGNLVKAFLRGLHRKIDVGFSVGGGDE